MRFGGIAEMRKDKSHAITPGVRMQTSQTDFLGTLLSRAFHNEPTATYILPDEAARRAVLSWFFSSVAIPVTQICGEIYTTAAFDGVSLWIRPECFLTFAQTVRTKVQVMRGPNLEPSSFRLWTNLTANMERVRQQLAKVPHWYLLAISVQASKAVRDINGALVEPVLSRSDRDRLPCYVETFDEALLPFYKEYGFQIAGAGQAPRGGPSFWAMIRTPR
jgi:hypothetical protein